MLNNAVSNSCSGWVPGTMRATNQCADSICVPRRSAETTPAFTTLDLPLPLGPITAMKRPALGKRPGAKWCKEVKVLLGFPRRLPFRAC